jgi:hypothetical protein
MPAESNKEFSTSVLINLAPATSYPDAAMTNAAMP